MKKFYLLSLILFNNIACSNPPYTNNTQNIVETETCSYLLNEFNKVKYYPVSIRIQQGYEELAIQNYKNTQSNYFSNLLQNLKVIRYPYIDTHCYSLSTVIQDATKFHQTKQKWYHDFTQLINSKKITFRKTDKCYKFARPYYKLMIDKNPNIQIAKVQYFECLNINLRIK